jgi:hypothetical protein
MPTIYLDKLDTESEILKRLTFPGYSGKKFKVELTETISFSSTSGRVAPRLTTALSSSTE